MADSQEQRELLARKKEIADKFHGNGSQLVKKIKFVNKGDDISRKIKGLAPV